MQIDAFWVGAARVAERFPLAQLAQRAGGYARLREGGAPAWRRVGLPPPLVRLWADARPSHTGGQAVCFDDPRYPDALRPLPDAPPLLYVQGDPDTLALRAVALVGTRAATRYGRQVAHALGAAAAGAGFAVISGLARGVDAEAHRGALGQGITVAVLAHGLGHTSPARHQGLRRALLDAGGAVVTTHPDAEPARRWTFPRRNRWIAGLAAAVVVVEAPVQSGALHTVRAAADYGREVMAVPGPIGAPTSEACNQLIADGATPVLSAARLVEALGGPPPAAASWVDRLVEGEPLEAVARARGGSVAQLLDAIDLMEATGELRRLAGQRYVRGAAGVGLPR